jgi:hypothetical protein
MRLAELLAGLQDGRPVLVVFFGMTASGKSTLGRAWAEHRRAPYYNTDRVRKELAGLQVTDRRPDGVGRGIYSAEFTERTYQAMLDRARGDFARGKTMVVLDGSYGRRADRDRVRALAAEAGVSCVFFLCTCPEEETRRRLALRSQDSTAVSDGRWEIYLHQQQAFELPDAVTEPDCIRLNTARTVTELLDGLAAHPWGCG